MKACKFTLEIYLSASKIIDTDFDIIFQYACKKFNFKMLLLVEVTYFFRNINYYN